MWLLVVCHPIWGWNQPPGAQSITPTSFPCSPLGGAHSDALTDATRLLLFLKVCSHSVSGLFLNLENDYNIRFSSVSFILCQSDLNSVYLFKWLVYFCTPGFLIVRNLHFSPSRLWENFVLCCVPVPGTVHAIVYVCPFSCVLPFGSLNHFSLPGTMQRTKISLWGSINLDRFLWGCVTSWISRNLQWSSWKTRLLFLIVFSANVCVFGDIGKGISSMYIIPGLDFQRKAAGAEWAHLCVFKFPCSQFVWRGVE